MSQQGQFLLFIMSAIFCGSYLKADLNGTITPIFVESSYTFTDGETAKGFVSFRNGFDIPVNGTVILELAPGMGVDGAVNFNGGTLELREHCIFGPRVVINGKGFIKSNGSALFLENPINILTNNPFTLLGNISIIGIGFPLLSLRGTQGGLNLASDALLSCTFKNLDITPGNIDLLFTSSTNMRELVFDHCNIRFGTGVLTILKNPRVIMMQECSLFTDRQYLAVEQELYIDGRLTLGSLSELHVGSIIMASENDRFTIQSAKLNVINTTSLSNEIVLGSQVVPQGNFVIEGKSILTSSVGQSIRFSDQLNLEFSSGARLSLDQVKIIV